MRALLTPEIVPRLGLVLLKPGKELMHLFANGRVLVEPVPQSMVRLVTGRVPDARQPLAEDRTLHSFFTDERVIRAAGGLPGLEYWLERNVRECQNPHSDYHHHELVTMRHAPGAMMLCWHCENQLREQFTERLAALARQNVINWLIDTVLAALRFNRDRELSLAELCWWAVYVGVAEAIPEDMAAQALMLPVEPIPTAFKESDIVPTVPATSILQKKVKPAQQRQPVVEQQPAVLALRADPESPESFMLRPKRRRWENAAYKRWVKSQPCECCRRPADDPHHVIGHGMGGTATKAHDLFVFPLCRECHDELHADVTAFERKHGTQLALLFRFLDRALAVGVIVKA
ncbi:DUF968 domain-containing protein [Lelliottia amnigena]|uniref:DUF968 domain-containing protein n=1 Tax=Lelliottia amnigena TaxID=61646 RepID=A0AAP2AE43_LELAM|nr:DUF968 domain-containing protein [Lelliottia amnigena]MBL5899950.1 DUF968 domain-containing protein [Lelliottia amnigena]MBL5935464.1 DUF968 domain-containing protein [Lelliottia amnigena]